MPFYLMKSFAFLTMKSKQVWIISSLRSNEIKSVLISAAGDLICVAAFIHTVDLFRRKTDLVEKSTCFLQVLFSGFRLHNRCRSKKPLFYQGLRIRLKMPFSVLTFYCRNSNHRLMLHLNIKT